MPVRAKILPDTPRRAEFLRGVRLGIPILLGYVPIGMAFGVIAVSIGFGVLQAVACSATALAGAGQFIALAVMKTGDGLAAVLAASTVVNLRYVLFGATLSPYLRGMPLGRQAVLAFTLTDETFAVNVNDRREGRSTGWSMAGVGAVAWAGWVAGTLVGGVATGFVGDPSRWGVEFAMPAMFTALLVALAEDRRHLLVGLLAGAVTVGLPALTRVGIHIPAGVSILVASVATATVATLACRDE